MIPPVLRAQTGVARVRGMKPHCKQIVWYKKCCWFQSKVWLRINYFSDWDSEIEGKGEEASLLVSTWQLSNCLGDHLLRRGRNPANVPAKCKRRETPHSCQPHWLKCSNTKTKANFFPFSLFNHTQERRLRHPIYACPRRSISELCKLCRSMHGVVPLLTRE